jgi:hypothetical protein
MEEQRSYRSRMSCVTFGLENNVHEGLLMREHVSRCRRIIVDVVSEWTETQQLSRRKT